MQKLSLFAAIIININIMLGTGLFINTTELASRAGALSWLSYAIVGVIMMPLILCIAYLARMHPRGGFYTFNTKEFNPTIGFISTWVYATGKLSSATIATYAGVLLLQSLVPLLQTCNPLVLSSAVLCLFGYLNMQNMQTGSAIQKIFLYGKIIPIVFVALVSLFYFSPEYVTTGHMMLDGIPSSIPLVLFAILGFEAACSLSNHIEDPEKNAPRAILTSFMIIISIYCVYQYLAFALFGPQCYAFATFRDFFQALAEMVPAPYVPFTATVLYSALAASSLGGAYGMLYSNVWNLHTLAQNNHFFKSPWFFQLNKHAIPRLCVIAEIGICLLYLWTSQGTQLPLQQIAAMGVSSAYFISVCALAYAKYSRPLSISWATIICGLISCTTLTSFCITYVIRGGSVTLYAYVALLAFGISMFYVTKKANALSKEQV